MSDQSASRSFWLIWLVLFLSMSLTVPLFYYLVVVGGFVPYAVLIAIAIHNLRDPMIGTIIIDGVQVFVYGALLLGVSKIAAKKIMDIRIERRRLVWLYVVLGLLFVMGLLPIYGVSHGGEHLRSVYRVWSIF